MNQAILYNRLGRLMKRRADCLEEIERLRATEDKTSPIIVRAQSQYEKTLRSIEEVNIQIDTAEHVERMNARKTNITSNNESKNSDGRN